MLSISPSKHRVQSSVSAPPSTASPPPAPRTTRVPSATLSAELKASLVEAPALPAKTRVPLPKERVSDAGTIRPDANTDPHHCSSGS
ncbi:hypothetical protein CgunFtcFv8_018391 [Champsocephalus gunnari]|uniref:Uncharacterized protein n=1 Tax=Champsocephalus gunnari TaxID=52237 RepID=A0AAN8BTA9_CHAGU|nr:hypothetical protein CgunFtcFv8_018391 [Champsocephalus gunnari]